MELPVDDRGFVRRAAALDLGFTDDALSTLTARGELEHLGHGDYVHAERLPDGPRRGDVKYRLRCIAFATSGRGAPPTLSHESAAALHGLRLLKPSHTDIHLLSGPHGRGMHRHRRHIHQGTVDDSQALVVDGVRVTSLARTAIDVACSTTFAGALTVLDSAIDLGTGRDALTMELERTRRIGSSVARRALHHASGLSESVGESWSRAQLIHAGIEVPELQVWYDIGGRRDCRVDFDWHRRLVGEFDGLKKYGRSLRRSGESVEDVVIREKTREDRLRALGVMVIRWTWADLESGRLPNLVRPWLRRLT
ncbi:MAG: hypothetical protein QM774_04115 [Gordonia sp. (in: high G+C Gram-positive bacteria)]|uniref:hypothetical protein n=1 Tax=Gordonia sp. (in: high G+C Gram-positive bacteria) TaxID=84139 RepID=UPI0039E6BB19